MSVQITPELLKTLPAEVTEQLRVGSRTSTGAADIIYPLIGAEEPVDLNQLIVGVWQTRKRVLKRTTVMAAINSLRKNGLVRRCGRGSYIRGVETE